MNRKKRKLHSSLLKRRSNSINLSFGYKAKKEITHGEGNTPPVIKYNKITYHKGPNGGGDGSTPPVKEYNKSTHHEGPNGGGDGNTPPVKKYKKRRIR